MSDLVKIEKLQQMLRTDPSNFQARRQLAMILLDSGYTKEALAHFLHLAEIFKDDSELFYNIGIIYEKLKDLKKAKDAYETAIQLAPDDVDAYYNLGLVYTDLGEQEKAIDCFETVLDADNDDSNTYFNIGICYFKQGKFDSAKYYFQRTIDLNDEDLYAHFYMGNIFVQEGQGDLAKEEFLKVLNVSPDYSWAYYNIAVLDFEQGDIISAINNLKLTLKYNPKDVEAYKVWAQILIKGKSYLEAVQVLNNALSRCGEIGDLFYLRGEAYKRNGDIEKSKDSISLALKNFNTLSFDIEVVKDKLNSM